MMTARLHRIPDLNPDWGLSEFSDQVEDVMRVVDGAMLSVHVLWSPEGWPADCALPLVTEGQAVMWTAPGPLPDHYYLESAYADRSGCRPVTLLDWEDAEVLWDRMRRRYVEGRMTKHRQASVEVPPESEGRYVLYPLQGPEAVHVGRMTWRESLDAALEIARASGARLLLKPHPVTMRQAVADDDFTPSARALLRRVEWFASEHDDVMVCEAHVHDLLAGALGVVGMTSSVCFEALLHELPVVSLANCPWEAATLSYYGDPMDLRRERAMSRDAAMREVASYVSERLIDARQSDTGERILLRMCQAIEEAERWRM